jgi:hypothetical protein
MMMVKVIVAFYITMAVVCLSMKVPVVVVVTPAGKGTTTTGGIIAVGMVASTGMVTGAMVTRTTTALSPPTAIPCKPACSSSTTP